MSQGSDMCPKAVSQQSRRLFLRGSTAIAIAGGSAAILGSPGKLLAGAPNVSSHGQGGRFFQIRADERDHVAFLLDALGADARPMPTFQGLLQPSFSKFANVAQALENTGCGAYLGAVPYIKNNDYLSAAGTIALIEARHAGYLNTFLGDPITGNAVRDDLVHPFEVPFTAAMVGDMAGPFIANLNGGPPVGYDEVQSDANDIAILNFALALEFLEREFYELNYAKYFSKN